MDKIERWSATLNSYKMLSAEQYYQAGTQLMASAKSVFSYRKPSFYFQISEQYVPEYKDADALAVKAQSKGTIRVFVSQTAIPQAYNNATIALALDEHIKSTLQPIIVHLPFVEITSTRGKADYILNTLVSTWHLDQPGLEQKTHEFSKEVNGKEKDKDGNPIKVTKKAKVYEHTKTVIARSSLTFDLISTASGDIEQSGSVESQFRWVDKYATGSGNTEIAPKQLRKLLGRKPSKQPNQFYLYHQAVNNAAGDIARQLRGLINQLGTQLSE